MTWLSTVREDAIQLGRLSILIVMQLGIIICLLVLLGKFPFKIVWKADSPKIIKKVGSSGF